MGFVEKYGLSHQNIAFFSSPSLDPAILKQEIALRLNHTFPRGSKKAQVDVKCKIRVSRKKFT